MPDYKWGENPYKQYPPRGISPNGMDIVENPDTNPMLIGHTMAWCNDIEAGYNEAVAKLDEYYNWLVRLGEIVPEKTAEEIAKETADEQLKLAKEQNEKQALLIEQQTQALALMMQKLETMGGVANGHKPSVPETTAIRTKGSGNAKPRPGHEAASGNTDETIQ